MIGGGAIAANMVANFNVDPIQEENPSMINE